MGLAPDSSVPLATAGVQWLCKGPWVQNGLFGYRRCSPGTGSLAAHRSSIIQPDHKGRSRGAGPFKVFILVCREIVLDSIAPNITNKQQSKWSPSQPLVGISILVPGESLLFTALNLLCNLDSLLFWKAVSKTEHLCNVFQLYIVTCTLRYRYNLCSGRQGDKFWFLLCFPIRSAQLPGFPRVGPFLRHPVQLLIDRNKMPLCTYFNRIVCLYLAKMYEWSFGDKEMSRVPKYGIFFF